MKKSPHGDDVGLPVINLRSVAAFLLGAVLGGWGFVSVLGHSAPHHPPGSLNLVNDTQREQAEPSPPVSDAREPGACEREYAQAQSLRARISLLKNRSRTARPERPPDPRCTPVEWPTGLPAKYREDGLRENLGVFLEGRELELDCSEFPCIALLKSEPGQAVDVGALKQNAYAGAKFVDMAYSSSEYNTTFFVPVPSDRFDRALQERIDGRVQAHIREFERDRPIPSGPPPRLELRFPLPGAG